MTRPLLMLVVMAKDEADNIRAIAESVGQHADVKVLVDTGSTDDTVLNARGVFDEILGFPPTLRSLKRGGTIFDFAANRNHALRMAEEHRGEENKPFFTIMLSGHETLHVEGDKLREYLSTHAHDEAGAYCVNMRSGGRAFRYPRVFRVGGGWMYCGATHEQPQAPQHHSSIDAAKDAPIIPGVVIVHAPTDNARKLKRLRENDLPYFEERLEDAKTAAEQAEALLFLAETHAVLADGLKQADPEAVRNGSAWMTHQMAAMSFYWRYCQVISRSTEPKFDPRQWHYALMLYYELASAISPDAMYAPDELINRLQALCLTAPKLPEARFLLARLTAQVDVKMGLMRARDAAVVAKAHQTEPVYEVTETTLEWRSTVLAAMCCEQLSTEAKAKEEQVRRQGHARKLYEQALRAGAPVELVKGMRAEYHERLKQEAAQRAQLAEQAKAGAEIAEQVAQQTSGSKAGG